MKLKALGAMILALTVFAALIPILTRSESTTTIGVNLVPQGAILVRTGTSSAQFTYYLLNQNPFPVNVQVSINSSTSQFNLNPYSVEPVTLILPLGTTTVKLGGQTLYVKVVQVGNYSAVTDWVNSTRTQLFVEQVHGPGVYVFNLTMYSPTGVPSPTVFTSNIPSDKPWNSSTLNPFVSSYNLQSSPYEYLFAANLTPGSPAGLYYFYVDADMYNYSVPGALTGSTGVMVVLNLSYITGGVPLNSMEVPSPLFNFSNNGISGSVGQVQGYFLVYIRTPFSYTNQYQVLLNGSEGAIPVTLSELRGESSLYGFTVRSNYYGSSPAVPWAFTPNSVEVAVPAQFVGKLYSIKVTEITPSGTITTGFLSPSTTTSTTTSSTTPSTSTSTSSSTSTTSTTSSSTSTSTSTTTTSTSSSTQHGGFPVYIVIAVVVIIVIIAIVILARR